MILNIEFNPVIEERLKMDKLILGGLNEIDESTIYPSGMGLKLEMLLNIFNEKSFLTGFLGTDNREYKSLFLKNKDYEFIEVKDRLARSIILEEKSRNTNIRSQYARITEEEIIGFYNLYHTLLSKAEYVVGFNVDKRANLGNIQNKLAQIARIKEKKYIGEIKTTENIEVLKEKPYLVILSLEILEYISNLKLENKKDIVAASNYVLDMGIKNIFINLYEKGLIYVSDKDAFIIKSKEELNFNKNCNCGLIAGILIGLKRNYNRDMLFKLCLGYNIIYNSREIQDITLLDVKKSMANILTEKIY